MLSVLSLFFFFLKVESLRILSLVFIIVQIVADT